VRRLDTDIGPIDALAPGPDGTLWVAGAEAATLANSAGGEVRVRR
jgi:hypothetical protein